ncbi:MAG: hypothetical protein ACLQAH_05030 [Limisphaerales bacterium]
MLNKKLGWIALLAGVAAGQVWAGTITSYSIGDVLVCFRKGAVDMVVDAGPLSTLTNTTVNQGIPINEYTGTQLAKVGTNGVSWSAFTWTSDNTLYVSEARSDLNTEATPWQRKSGSTQFYTVARMETIPPGALDELTANVYPVSSSTAVVEDDDSHDPPYNQNYVNGVSYHDALAGSSGGNFNQTFVGNPENTTLANFTTSGQVIRSDFFQLIPSSGYGVAFGKWLGYFELSTNGAMTYVAYPTTTPAISSVSYNGTVAVINYTTGPYGTYTLLESADLTAPISTWTTVATLSTGDNATHTYTDTTSDNNRFYIISAQ